MVGLEYDGRVWHKNIEKDKKKFHFVIFSFSWYYFNSKPILAAIDLMRFTIFRDDSIFILRHQVASHAYVTYNQYENLVTPWHYVTQSSKAFLF